MENLLQILNLLNNTSKQNETPTQQEIPKEILDQYPYGDFPIRYTKVGQENIRKQSEKRFSYEESIPNKTINNEQNNNLNLTSLLPFIQLMSGKKQPHDMMKLLSQLLFKDNKDMQKLFELFPMKSQEIKNNNNFPDLNKVKISSLKRIE